MRFFFKVIVGSETFHNVPRKVARMCEGARLRACWRPVQDALISCYATRATAGVESVWDMRVCGMRVGVRCKLLSGVCLQGVCLPSTDPHPQPAEAPIHLPSLRPVHWTDVEAPLFSITF
mmetsp:Transcript_3741/g.10458  ORF Transcript_3741/g.10458 Transcript_3741/m.10458 type:complete len:120 (+) Transcript_3741:636-995(+)